MRSQSSGVRRVSSPGLRPPRSIVVASDRLPAVVSFTGKIDLSGSRYTRLEWFEVRLLLVLLGLVLVLVGLFVTALGLLTWVAFLGGIVLIGVGLMVDSKAKAAAKARARSKSRGY